MSIYRRAKKRDQNEPEIVQALQSAGARVWRLDRPFDLLVGISGRFTVLEVKSHHRERKDQQHQSDELRACQAGGLPVYRVESVDAALQAVGLRH